MQGVEYLLKPRTNIPVIDLGSCSRVLALALDSMLHQAISLLNRKGTEGVRLPSRLSFRRTLSNLTMRLATYVDTSSVVEKKKKKRLGISAPC